MIDRAGPEPDDDQVPRSQEAPSGSGSPGASRSGTADPPHEASNSVPPPLSGRGEPPASAKRLVSRDGSSAAAADEGSGEYPATPRPARAEQSVPELEDATVEPRGKEQSGEYPARTRPDADAASVPPEDGRRRVSQIWREWLGALQKDSEAAMAAALAYRQLSEDVRDEWISALEADVDGLMISRVAVFAPMLAVETDPARRLRIAQALQPGLRDLAQQGEEEYLQGDLNDVARVVVIVSPLYLDFVQVLACAYVPGERFLWVRHDPIARRDEVGAVRDALSDVRLEAAPVRGIVDDLARTIVAVHRRGDPLPEALCLFAHLFGAAI